MPTASTSVRRTRRELPRQQPNEFVPLASWGQGAASALRRLRSLEQRRLLTQPLG